MELQRRAEGVATGQEGALELWVSSGAPQVATWRYVALEANCQHVDIKTWVCECVLWVLGVMLCMLYCMLLRILEVVEGELRLPEVLE